MIQVYSFDVFETCLVRYYTQPEDFFLTWAEKVLLQPPAPSCIQPCPTPGSSLLPAAPALSCTLPPRSWPTPEHIQDLARLRLQTASLTRKKSLPKEDITLAEIYQNFVCPSWCSASIQTMMDLEMQLERQCVRPIEGTRQRIQALRAKQARIIFVSAMYLSSDCIRQMLQDHHFIQPEDHLYVSGELGLGKNTGNLYKHVLQAEKIKANEMQHYGDDTCWDYVIPRRLGITVEQYFDSRLAGYEPMVYESCLASQPIASIMAGITRTARLMQPIPSHPSWPAFVSQVIAPLLTAFVAWVLQDAKQKGIQRLYFVSRDGQILQKIAQRIIQKSGEPMPECRYLYGSRQAWFFPGIEKIDRKNLDWLIIPGHSKSPRHLLAKLRIEPEEIKDTLAQYGFLPETWDRQMSDAVENFWQVLENEQVQQLLSKKIIETRQLALDYFTQEGIGAALHPWALVDSGWTLKSQRAICNIFRAAGKSVPVMGYYLGLSYNRVMIEQCGEVKAMLESAHFEAGHSWGALLVKYARIVEQVFTVSDHGSVTGYVRQSDGSIQASCKPYRPSPQHQQFLPCFTKTILDYTDLVMDSGIYPHHIDDLKRTALMTMRAFFTQPNPDYVKGLLWVQFGDDQNESRMYSLSKKLGIVDCVRLARYFFAYLRKGSQADFPQQYSWWEGCVAISPAWSSFLFRIAFQWRRNLLNSRFFLNWQTRHLGKVK